MTIGVYKRTKKHIEICRKGGIAVFKKHPNQASEMGKKGAETCKKKKIGCFYNSESHRIVCKRGGEIGGHNGGIKGVETNKKNGTGMFNPIFHSMGGSAAQKSIRDNGPYIFNTIHFANNAEMEFGMNIHYQIESLKERENYQFVIDNKSLDFFIKRFKCFIEYHPWDRSGLTYKEYYDIRKKLLNKNGYKDYNLIVIK